MTVRGRVENGVVVPDQSDALPEGAAVQIEVITSPDADPPRRMGGQLKGQIWISDEFDDLPDDIADAFGMREP